MVVAKEREEARASMETGLQLPRRDLEDPQTKASGSISRKWIGDRASANGEHMYIDVEAHVTALAIIQKSIRNLYSGSSDLTPIPKAQCLAQTSTLKELFSTPMRSATFSTMTPASTARGKVMLYQWLPQTFALELML